MNGIKIRVLINLQDYYISKVEAKVKNYVNHIVLFEPNHSQIISRNQGYAYSYYFINFAYFFKTPQINLNFSFQNT